MQSAGGLLGLALGFVAAVSCGGPEPIGKCTDKSCPAGCCNAGQCIGAADQGDQLCGAGGADCSGCGAGLTCDASGSTGGKCALIDACATNHGGCDANATCTTTQFGSTCACPAGFVGDGKTCTPVLTDIMVSAGFVSPAFNSDVLAYVVVVPATTTTLTITATTAATQAMILINGQGGPSRQLPVSAAAQTVTVDVRAGAAVRHYTLDVSRSSTSLSQHAVLKPSTTVSGERFGTSVAVSADGATMAVGTPFESSAATGVNGNQADTSALRAGAVFVFHFAAGAWTQQAYLKASNTEAYDNFGYSVALSADGSTLAVGATGEDSDDAATPASNAAHDSGALYVFHRTGATWAQEAYLKGSGLEAGDELGWSVTLSGSGDVLVAGAPGDDGPTNGASASGAVFAYTRTGAAWTSGAPLRASTADLADIFGLSVALSGDGTVLVVGATGEDSAAVGVNGNAADNSNSNSGAVYVFRSSGGAFAQEAYLKASNSGPQDRFGTSVSTSQDGSVVAVGAPGESSSALGVGGSQSNDDVAASGAVYVFRKGSTWAQEAYVKATNTAENDRFGAAVAVSQDGATLVVGAPNEDSDATGVDGNQSSDAANDSGALFVYRHASAWTRHAYLKAGIVGVGDTLGTVVSVSASGAVIGTGASGEDSASTGVNADVSDNNAMESGAGYVFSL